MHNNLKKIISDIVWYIPFKKLRNALREYLYIIASKDSKTDEILNKLEYIRYVEEAKHQNLFYNLWENSMKETIDYVNSTSLAINSKWFEDKFKMYEYVFEEYIKNNKYDDKLFLEFGVYTGGTINKFSSLLSEVTFYGFDCFQGLTEDSGIWNKNDYSTNGNIPEVNKNVSLIIGYFDKTLPSFFETHSGDIKFIHVDSDTYSAAVDIFKNCENRITQGTIIIFDEYFNYPAWKFNEYKAFQDFCNRNNVKYKDSVITKGDEELYEE